METYAKALLYAIPFFVVLVLIEIAYGYIVKNQKYTLMDTVSSLSSGLTNIIKDSLGLIVVLVSYPFLLEYLAIIHIKTTWVVWVIAFLAIDFAGYWNHRLSHAVNIFWNQHVIHHSSEEFNLSCALRQPIANIFGYYALLLIPAAIMGVPNEVIALLAPLHLFAQFWYHTQHIGKLGWVEYILVTPSQHRVHHAINPEYIDKNLGQILSIWDRMFGTFQEELDNVPPKFGVLKPVKTWNPVIINFQHFWRLCLDAYRTRSFRDKFRIWFMPTGWRPKDVRIKYPINSIKDVYAYNKYYPYNSTLLKIYAVLQLLTTTMLLMYMFDNYSILGFRNLLVLGGILFLGVFGYTAVMDNSKYGFYMELIRGILGITSILSLQKWVELPAQMTVNSTYLIGYLLFCIAAAYYFIFIEKKESIQNTVVSQ
ncbi:sterol desaturase family protein [Croceivirga sp. JEA036]|uniref:sterol desaturase family protein n=1 Tax=Croceivirga sp. JEA036 TaxID=2721162 RepID=UPI00143B8084|nr:sterol desaturase family protein [Croceivirga sp. JEA036]NJB35974.1 sterol desaturase family protein [Croceivirga sp. JEA036]